MVPMRHQVEMQQNIRDPADIHVNEDLQLLTYGLGHIVDLSGKYSIQTHPSITVERCTEYLDVPSHQISRMDGRSGQRVQFLHQLIRVPPYKRNAQLFLGLKIVVDAGGLDSHACSHVTEAEAIETMPLSHGLSFIQYPVLHFIYLISENGDISSSPMWKAAIQSYFEFTARQETACQQIGIDTPKSDL
jgi:hypothetical protein